MRTGSNPIIEILTDGSLLLSDIVNGQRIKQRYYYTTKRQAKSKFRLYCQSLVRSGQV